MTTFRDIISSLLLQAQTNFGPDKWIVECVFYDQVNKDRGMYTTVGVFSSKDEAENEAIKCNSTLGHKFLFYRARPVVSFREFGPDGVSISSSKDATLEEEYKRRIEMEVTARKKAQAKRSTSEAYHAASIKEGTVENMVSLIHRAYYLETELKRKQRDLANVTQEASLASLELLKCMQAHPELHDKVLPYLETYMEAMGDTESLKVISEWYLKISSKPKSDDLLVAASTPSSDGNE